MRRCTLFYIFLVLFFASCRSVAPAVQESTREVVREVVRTDTIITIAPDTATLEALPVATAQEMCSLHNSPRHRANASHSNCNCTPQRDRRHCASTAKPTVCNACSMHCAQKLPFAIAHTPRRHWCKMKYQHSIVTARADFGCCSRQSYSTWQSNFICGGSAYGVAECNCNGYLLAAGSSRRWKHYLFQTKPRDERGGGGNQETGKRKQRNSAMERVVSGSEIGKPTAL